MVPGPRNTLFSTLDTRAARLGDALAFWAIAAFCIFLLFASCWIPAARKLRVLECKEDRVSSEIRVLRDENGRLECCLDGLYNDPYYVELILRREHGFLKEGEKVVKPDLVKVKKH